jgi:hypothetical protein
MKELKYDNCLFPDGFDHDVDIFWSKRKWKSYFGVAEGGKHNRIRINLLLNAPDIPGRDEVLKLVVFHEMLHFEVPGGHTPQFKRREALFPALVLHEMVHTFFIIIFEKRLPTFDFIFEYKEDERNYHMEIILYHSSTDVSCQNYLIAYAPVFIFLIPLVLAIFFPYFWIMIVYLLTTAFSFSDGFQLVRPLFFPSYGDLHDIEGLEQAKETLDLLLAEGVDPQKYFSGKRLKRLGYNLLKK